MIGIVTPWFGEELKGGAEQLAWQLAQRLAGRGHRVEVLTTCSRSFLDEWENQMPPGVRTEGAVTVRRFSIDRRDRRSFDRINGRLMAIPPARLQPGIPPIPEADEAKFWQGNVNSARLVAHLEESGKEFRALVFLPYLYGIVLQGLPKVRDKAYLQPCLHDEAYAYLRGTADLFYATNHLLLNSDGELETLRTIFGAPLTARAIVVGTGIESGADGRFAGTRVGDVELSSRFVLCLGRRDEGKGVGFLARSFAEFRRRNPREDLRLVLAGPGGGSFGDAAHGIHDLGLVGNAERDALLGRCIALAQPSLRESYSRVLIEAWRHGKPVLVQRRCAATAGAVSASGGGWALDGEEQWTSALAMLSSASAADLADIGARGAEYSHRHGDWERVMDRYEAAFLESDRAAPRRRPTGARFRVDQVLPNLAAGDAISNYARAIRDQLRGSGHESEIYVRHLDPRLPGEGIPLADRRPPGGTRLIYHHSIGSEVTDWVLSHEGPKAMIYHNITPGRFFRTYDPALADLLDAGRDQLPRLADAFAAAAGDSGYNVEELRRAGFPDPLVLPIPIDGSRLAAPSDPRVAAELAGEGTNLLFVGRIAPQKRQDDLIVAFAEYARLDHAARLHLVGSCGAADGYVRHLKSLIWKLGLAGRVSIPGSVSESALRTYYRGADLFWSMSEHEGFCVPLIEAMWFEVPVLAFKSSAVPETVGEAGILFDSKADPARIAALAKVVVEDESVRAPLVEAGRTNRGRFTLAAHTPVLEALLGRLAGVEAPHA